MLTTARLTLIPPKAEHFDAYAAFWAKPAGNSFGALAPMRADDAWMRLLRSVGHWGSFGFGTFLAFNQNGALMAEVGYMDCRRGLGPSFGSAPEGMWKVDIDAQKQGFAAEAVAAATAWLDTTIAPPRTVCMIDPDNAGSIRVARRLGFVEFGHATYRESLVTLFERKLPA